MGPLPLEDSLLALQSQSWGLWRKAGGNASKMQREANAIKNQELGEPDLYREGRLSLLADAQGNV